MWVDVLGCYVRVEARGGAPYIVRVPFASSAIDMRDAKSKITMMAQISWEEDKKYVPETPLMMLQGAQTTEE